MEVTRLVELARIDELKILHNVRLINRHDLNPITSSDNLHVQFYVSGDVKGNITCHLCLDGQELSDAERNYLFPLFTESMNILVGRQISLDDEFRNMRIQLSPPKLSMIAKIISTNNRNMIQKYELELEALSLDVLIEYSLEGMN
ncbi:MAG: hypothetical protein V4598_15925 [Bdellovibrionota bacterium]